MDGNVVERMMRYIECASVSGNEAAFYQLLASELKELGCYVSPCLQNGSDLTVPNLYARLPGRGEPLLFSAHMDTVRHDKEIEPFIEKGVVRSRGDTILGADDKSGIAAILEALTRIVDSNRAHIPVEILFTVGEETGMTGSRFAEYSMVESKCGYVFDSSATFGSVIVQSPQIRQYRFCVRGKAAHAAIHPELGVNALVVAAKIISAVEWGRAGGASTLNVGSLKAEGATNVICDYAEFDMETRSFEPDGAAALGESIRTKARGICMQYGAELTVEERLRIPGFSLERSAPVFAPLVRAFTCGGIELIPAISHGGSDANYFNENGIAAVNISTGMRESHSTDEHISIDELKQITDIITTLMESTTYEA